MVAAARRRRLSSPASNCLAPAAPALVIWFRDFRWRRRKVREGPSAAASSTAQLGEGRRPQKSARHGGRKGLFLRKDALTKQHFIECAFLYSPREMLLQARCPCSGEPHRSAHTSLFGRTTSFCELKFPAGVRAGGRSTMLPPPFPVPRAARVPPGISQPIAVYLAVLRGVSRAGLYAANAAG